MNAIPFWRSVVVLALAGITVAACFLGAPAVGVSESGVNMHLPEKVAGYTGKDVPVSESERAILPSDTEFAKKMSAAKAKLLRVCKIESPLPPPRFL